MTNPQLPGSDDDGKNGEKKPWFTSTRLLIWLGVSGVALYSIITGIVGMLTKSR